MFSKYLFRKLIYAVCSAGTVAGAAYVAGHQDITSWTLHGLAGALVAGIWGVILSGPLGGALSKP